MTLASTIARMRTRLFGIALAEARLDRRGFQVTSPEKQRRLELIGETFIRGYMAALIHGDPAAAADCCESVRLDLRGFAYEGASMGLALVDLFAGGRPKRFRAFIDGPAERHIYMAHVGAGWALARCRWGLWTFLPLLDPLLSALAVDGIGFHQAYFEPAKYIDRGAVSRLRARDPESFDNGIGRALWFATGASAQTVIETIPRFERSRHAALWSGIGLAASYAGGASTDELRRLRCGAGPHLDELRVGAAFAAKARLRAGNATLETARTCETLSGCRLERAAAATDAALERTPARGRDSYRVWRRLTIEALG